MTFFIGAGAANKENPLGLGFFLTDDGYVKGGGSTVDWGVKQFGPEHDSRIIIAGVNEVAQDQTSINSVSIAGGAATMYEVTPQNNITSTSIWGRFLPAGESGVVTATYSNSDRDESKLWVGQLLGCQFTPLDTNESIENSENPLVLDVNTLNPSVVVALCQSANRDSTHDWVGVIRLGYQQDGGNTYSIAAETIEAVESPRTVGVTRDPDGGTTGVSASFNALP